MNQNVYNQIKQDAYSDELQKIAGGFFSKDETRARMDASNAKRYAPSLGSSSPTAAAPKPNFFSAEATRGRMNDSNAQRYAVKPSPMASAPLASAKPMAPKKV